jgi:hypothetical protein
MKTKLYGLLTLLGAFILLSSSCCKPKEVKELTEYDRVWIPYQVGDSLAFYHGDTLKAKARVRGLITDGTTTNKGTETCPNAYRTEVLTVNLTIVKDDLYENYPSNFIILYRNDQLNYSSHGVNDEENPLADQPRIDTTIDGEIYNDVVVIYNPGAKTHYLKHGVGLLACTISKSITGQPSTRLGPLKVIKIN